MIIKDLEDFSKKIKGKLFFEYNIKNLNWFNIGGQSKVFKPDSLKELMNFLKVYNNRGKLTVLGAGSNILFSDKMYEGAIIKLSNSSIIFQF